MSFLSEANYNAGKTENLNLIILLPIWSTWNWHTSRTWQWKDCHWVRRTSVSDPLLVLQTGLWDEQSGPPVHAVTLPMGTNPDKLQATKYRHLSMPLATVIALLHCSSLIIQYCTHWPRYDGLLLFCKHGKAFPKNNQTQKNVCPNKSFFRT